MPCTGAAVDQEGFAAAQLGAVEVGQHGGCHFDQSGRADQVDTRGGTGHLARRYHHVLRVGATGQQRDHLVAGLPVVHVIADRVDDAGALQAEQLGHPRRRWVVALALQQIGAIHPNRNRPDTHLIGARLRGRHLGPAHFLGSTESFKGDREHALSLPSERGGRGGLAWFCLWRDRIVD